MYTRHVGWAQKSICGIEGKLLARRAVWASALLSPRGGHPRGTVAQLPSLGQGWKTGQEEPQVWGWTGGRSCGDCPLQQHPSQDPGNWYFLMKCLRGNSSTL